MRLSPKERNAIIFAFSSLIREPFQLYLFGSRTADEKKGGDIDLLLVVTDSAKPFVIEQKTKIRTEIFERIPEQKIDITVATVKDLEADQFLKAVFPQAILLFKQ